MRRLKPKSTLVLLAAVGITAAAAWAADNAASGIAWQTNLAEAHRLSIDSDKPMLLVFGADWCYYCKKLDQTTLTNPELVRYINSNFIPIHIDVDQQKRVAEILEVEKLPCSVILNPQADLLARFNGFKPPSAYYEELAKARRSPNEPVQTASHGGATKEAR